MVCGEQIGGASSDRRAVPGGIRLSFAGAGAAGESDAVTSITSNPADGTKTVQTVSHGADGSVTQSSWQTGPKGSNSQETTFGADRSVENVVERDDTIRNRRPAAGVLPR